MNCRPSARRAGMSEQSVRDRADAANFQSQLLADKFSGLLHCPNFDPGARTERDPVSAQAEAFDARASPDFTPVGNFVDTELLLMISDDEVLIVQRAKLLVVTAR